MGQARIKGSFEARKQAAIQSGRVKVKNSGSSKHYYYDPFLDRAMHGDEIMDLALATAVLCRLRKRTRK